MRRSALVGALLLVVLLGACGRSEVETSALIVVRDSASEPVKARSWRLPVAGRIVGIGGVSGDLRIAQRLRVSRLSSTGGVEALLDPPAEARIVALSHRGGRVGLEDRDGLRVGRPEAFDPASTALWSFGELGQPIVFDNHPARIYAGALWDLDVPHRLWFPEAYGDAAALDPSQRWLAVGEELGTVTVLSTEDGTRVRELPRLSRARSAAEISALALAPRGEVFTLDRAGWVGCGSASVPALPLAPPAMPAAVALADGGVWALRGGSAVFVDCAPPVPRRVCEVHGGRGDPRSAELFALDGRVYAAGVVAGAVVELPRCRNR